MAVQILKYCRENIPALFISFVRIIASFKWDALSSSGEMSAGLIKSSPEERIRHEHGTRDRGGQMAGGVQVRLLECYPIEV